MKHQSYELINYLQDSLTFLLSNVEYLRKNDSKTSMQKLNRSIEFSSALNRFQGGHSLENREKSLNLEGPGKNREKSGNL